MGRISTFAKESSIPGVPELVEGRIIGKLFWATILVLAMVLLVIETRSAVIEFSNNPYSTKVSTMRLTKFPQVSICPMLWLNGSKVNEAGIKKNLFLAYILQFLHGGAEMTFLPSVDLVSNYVSSYRAKYEKLIQEYGNLSNLLKSFSFPGTAEFMEVECDSCQRDNEDIKVGMAVTGRGACYSISSGAMKKSTARAYSNPTLKLILKKQVMIDSIKKLLLLKSEIVNATKAPDLEGTKETLDEKIQNELKQLEFSFLFGNMGVGKGGPSGGIVVEGERNYDIFLNVIKNTLKADCSKNKDWQASCATKCQAEAYYKCNSSCIVYMGEWMEKHLKKSGKKTLPFCHQHDPHFSTKNNQNCIEEQLEVCDGLDVCPKPCKSWLYEPSVFPSIAGKEDGDMIIKVRLLNTGSVLSLEHVPNYTLSTLMSNIGGLLGLFYGASLLSIIQLCCHLCFCCKRPNTAVPGA